MTTTKKNNVAHYNRKLRSFHLFAGAGGGILADMLIGHRIVGACEIEPYPRNVILQRQRDGILPDFPIWDDIRTLDGTPWRGRVDVVSGGFPCQDISTAGKGAGIEGERSGMWVEMARIIGEMEPAYVFVENSPMLTSRGLGRVLGDLAGMGYDARWGVLGSGDIKAKHKRKRIWILAHTMRDGLQRGKLQQLLEKTQERQTQVLCDPGKLKRHTLSTPKFCRRNDGVANFVDRIKAVGNGQDPDVACLAWNLLTESLQQQTKQ